VRVVNGPSVFPQRPPNTCVQRTRSSPSAHRSPLTRHTLGRAESELTLEVRHGALSLSLPQISIS